MTDPVVNAREMSFETVAAGLNMTRPARPSTLRDAVDNLKPGTLFCLRCNNDVEPCGSCAPIPEGNHPSISPDAGQNRQSISPPSEA